jgi:hypothetical protein
MAARKNYRLWLENPRHGSIHFKRVGKFWSARVTTDYRALAIDIPEGYVWFWIGSHDDYERMLARS